MRAGPDAPRQPLHTGPSLPSPATRTATTSTRRAPSPARPLGTPPPRAHPHRPVHGENARLPSASARSCGPRRAQALRRTSYGATTRCRHTRGTSCRRTVERRRNSPELLYVLLVPVPSASGVSRWHCHPTHRPSLWWVASVWRCSRSPNGPRGSAAQDCSWPRIEAQWRTYRPDVDESGAEPA
jgi:hypothetical protein